MNTSTLVLGGIAILLLLNSSSKTPALVGGAKPAEKYGGSRTYGPGAPLPAQAPSGSPGGQTQGVTTLGALYTNVLFNADKIGSGIGDIISAARATDDGSGDDGSSTPGPTGPPPILSRDGASGGIWLGFNPGPLTADASTNAPWSSETPPIWQQDTSYDQAVPDYQSAVDV